MWEALSSAATKSGDVESPRGVRLPPSEIPANVEQLRTDQTFDYYAMIFIIGPCPCSTSLTGRLFTTVVRSSWSSPI